MKKLDFIKLLIAFILAQFILDAILNPTDFYYGILDALLIN
jgi:hypothetical protein